MIKVNTCMDEKQLQYYFSKLSNTINIHNNTILWSNGTFDLLLVKPRNIYLQIIGSNIGYEKVGRTLGSVSVLLYALSKVALYESNIRVFLLIPMIISSTIIFASISFV